MATASSAVTIDDPKTTRWYDSRVWIAALAPFAATIFAGLTIWFAVVPYLLYFTEKGVGASDLKKVFITGLMIFCFLATLYASLGFIQLLFVELREKFIAWKVVYRDGEFSLGGYYFKRARFDEAELSSIEEFKADPHVFSKHIATLLTRNSKIRCNYNLKVSLKDGRIFYLPGELDRLTLGETDQGDKLKAFLGERMRANNGA